MHRLAYNPLEANAETIMWSSNEGIGQVRQVRIVFAILGPRRIVPQHPKEDFPYLKTTFSLHLISQNLFVGDQAGEVGAKDLCNDSARLSAVISPTCSRLSKGAYYKWPCFFHAYFVIALWRLK